MRPPFTVPPQGPMAIPADEALRIACIAKTRVMREPKRACQLSVVEIACMARVLDSLLVDVVAEPRWDGGYRRPAAAPVIDGGSV